MLLANSGGPPLAGIIVNPSPYWPDLAVNVDGWNQLIAAARASGLRNIPDATGSPGVPLVRPADGAIEHTTPNMSDGAKLILDLSARLSLPLRPLVVVTGSRLTDVADAYLMDPTVADRVVVVSALGGAANGGSVMGWPNGELDAWADWIVGQRFRYIQVNGYYEQLGDVSSGQGRRPAGQCVRSVDGGEGSGRSFRSPCPRIRSACWRSACRPSSPRSGARSSTPPRHSTRRPGRRCWRRWAALPGWCRAATAPWRPTGCGRCCSTRKHSVTEDDLLTIWRAPPPKKATG